MVSYQTPTTPLHQDYRRRETPYLGYLNLHERIFAAVLEVLEGRQGQAIKPLALQAHKYTIRQAERETARTGGHTDNECTAGGKLTKEVIIENIATLRDMKAQAL